MSDDNGAGAGAELSYEPALDEGRREGDKGSGAGDVMSSVTASENVSFRNGFAVSPRSGSVIPATPEAAAHARAGKVAARERYRLAAEQGLLTAAQAVAVGVLTPEQGWAKIIEGQAEIALSPELSNSTAAAALVGRATGAIVTGKTEAAPIGNNGDLAELVAAWRQAKLDNPMLGQRAAGLVRGSDGDGE